MTKTLTLDDIMAQAQVFASSWSLVGGQFDDGSMLEVAEQEKRDLRAMAAQLAVEPPQPPVAARGEIERLQWKLREIAAECAECGGRGYTDECCDAAEPMCCGEPVRGACTECADIRALLPKGSAVNPGAEHGT